MASQPQLILQIWRYDLIQTGRVQKTNLHIFQGSNITGMSWPGIDREATLWLLDGDWIMTIHDLINICIDYIPTFNELGMTPQQLRMTLLWLWDDWVTTATGTWICGFWLSSDFPLTSMQPGFNLVLWMDFPMTIFDCSTTSPGHQMVRNMSG